MIDRTDIAALEQLGCVKEMTDVYYVYLLVASGEVTYIGETTAVASRIQSHRQTGRDFDRWFCIECKNVIESGKLESALIRYFRPKENSAHNTGPITGHDIPILRKYGFPLPEFEHAILHGQPVIFAGRRHSREIHAVERVGDRMRGRCSRTSASLACDREVWRDVDSDVWVPA